MNVNCDLLTVPEAAAALRLKTSTMRAWILQRRIQYAKLGGKVTLRRTDVEDFIRKGLVPAKEQEGAR
jgi:excisionase family DNA binding protein